MPNPLRCFNCQRFGHHESNCPVDIGSVCEKCGTGGHDDHTSSCKNKPKCVNCGKEHISRSNICEIWKKEKEIMKPKATKHITYLEAKKLFEFETQTSELDFSKIVQSLSSKPETKTTGTQFSESDFTIHPSTKVITPAVKPKSTSVSQSPSSSQLQSNSRSRSDSSRPHSQAGSQSTSKSSSQSSSQSNNSQSRSQSRPQSSSQSSSQRKGKTGTKLWPEITLRQRFVL